MAVPGESSQQTTLPMFPLGSVLMPGALLPLHVFEPRYQALVQDCIAGPLDFGVVLIARGHEVGGGDARHGIGTRAQLVQVARLDGGRFALLCVGRQRIRVHEWLEDDPYPRAVVSDWPDDDPLGLGSRWWDTSGQPSADLAALVARTRRLAALALELGDRGGSPTQAVGDGPVRASYDVVDLAPLGSADRYTLLGAGGPVERLDRLEGMLDDLEQVLQFRLGDDPSPPISPEAW